MFKKMKTISVIFSQRDKLQHRPLHVEIIVILYIDQPLEGDLTHILPTGYITDRDE